MAAARSPLVNDVVAVEHSTRAMPADAHDDRRVHARAHSVSYGRPAEVVDQLQRTNLARAAFLLDMGRQDAYRSAIGNSAFSRATCSHEPVRLACPRPIHRWQGEADGSRSKAREG